MTTKFGIEIEFVGMGPYTSEIETILRTHGFEARAEGYNHTTRDYWKLVPDGSVIGGAELVSPPLPHNSEGLGQVSKAFEALNAGGAQANNNCGIHIHVDTTWLRGYSAATRQQYFDFITLAFQAHEHLFDQLVKSTRIDGYYCRSTQGRSSRDLRNNRYHKLNLSAYTTHGTIEFRQLQGTMNAKAVKAWITLCVTFADNCRKRFEASLNPTAATPAVA